MLIDDIRFPNPHVRIWVETKLQSPGPWQNKRSLKEQVNCLLNFKLQGYDQEAMNIRGYLCNEDPDHIWVQSLEYQVFPFIVNQASEVLHG